MIDRRHELTVTKQVDAAASPEQRLLPAAPSSAAISSCAAGRAASGVSHRRGADDPRSIGCQGEQTGRRMSKVCGGWGRGVLASAHDEARTRSQNLPVSAARHGDRAAEPGLGHGYHLYPDGGLRYWRWCSIGSPGACCPGGYPSRWRRRSASDAGGCFGEARQAGDLQHRSGQPVYGRGLHRRARKDSRQEGWQGRLAGQRVRRAAVAQREIRGGYLHAYGSVAEARASIGRYSIFIMAAARTRALTA